MGLVRIVPTLEVELVRAIDRAVLPGNYFEDPDMGNLYWLAELRDKTPVGYCSVRPTQYDPTHTAFLSRSGVLPPYRGQGLQRRMIRVRVAWARRMSFQHVITYCGTYNVPSATNLIKEGFRPWWPPDSIGPWAGEDVIYFRKTL